MRVRHGGRRACYYIGVQVQFVQDFGLFGLGEFKKLGRLPSNEGGRITADTGDTKENSRVGVNNFVQNAFDAMRLVFVGMGLEAQ